MTFGHLTFFSFNYFLCKMVLMVSYSDCKDSIKCCINMHRHLQFLVSTLSLLLCWYHKLPTVFLVKTTGWFLSPYFCGLAVYSFQILSTLALQSLDFSLTTLFLSCFLHRFFTKNIHVHCVFIVSQSFWEITLMEILMSALKRPLI